jgi:DNA-binding NtrC family response regulator
MTKRILVVEDQPDNRRIIRDVLAGTDYEITEAEDGEQALAAVAKARPDLILRRIIREYVKVDASPVRGSLGNSWIAMQSSSSPDKVMDEAKRLKLDSAFCSAD